MSECQGVAEVYLEEANADADATDHADVVLDLGAEDVEAAPGVNLHGGLGVGQVQDAVAAAGDVGETAGVRDVVEAGEGDVGPVQVLLGAATVELEERSEILLQINTSSVCQPVCVRCYMWHCGSR